MIENWLPILSYEGLYEVSNLGRVRRLDRRQDVVRYGKMTTCIRKGGPVAAHPNVTGYLRSTLFKNGKANDHFLQRLVCSAFSGPPPSDDHQAAHLDGDNTNNRADNLAWKLGPANAADALKHGTYRRGARNSRSRLTDESVREMRRLRLAGNHNFQELADLFGVSHRAAFMAVKGITWAHVGD